MAAKGSGDLLPSHEQLARHTRSPDESLPPLDPKYKAIIIYFMFFAETAASSNKEDEQVEALMTCAQFAASEFSKRLYNVDIHPNDIKGYYEEVQRKNRKGGDWEADEEGLLSVVAQILSMQVKDEKLFDEVTSLLTNHRNDKKKNLPLYVQWFLSQAHRAAGKSRLTDKLKRRWSSFVGCGPAALRHWEEKENRPSILADPPLEQSSGVDHTTGSYYESLLRFKEYLIAIDWSPKNPDH